MDNKASIQTQKTDKEEGFKIDKPVKFFMKDLHDILPTFEYIDEHVFPVDKLYDRPEGKYIAYWYGNLKEDDKRDILNDQCLCTKVPGDNFLQNKDLEYRIINFLKKIYPGQYNFLNQSWVLPRHYDDMKSYVSANDSTFIAKPRDDGGGRGIFLFKTMEEYDAQKVDGLCVAQEYLKNPYLLGKKKWDLRVFAMIHGVKPMTAYIHKIGFNNVCADDFDLSDYANTQSHVTNPLLNVGSENYVTYEEAQQNDDVLPSHISTEQTFQLIKKQNPEIDIEKDLWEPIKRETKKFLQSM